MSNKNNAQNKKCKKDFNTKEERKEIKKSYKLGKKYYKEVEETHN